MMVVVAFLSLVTFPTGTWTYNDGTPEDTLYEGFGPRADRLLIKLYETAEPMWDALAAGEIDMTDWPLTQEYYNLFTAPPYNETINVVSYGAEFGLSILDINNNPNEYLGNPPDPEGDPNPVYPNPCSIREFRQAIAHLVDRTWLNTIIGPGFYTPLYTPVPPSMGTYVHPEIRPGGALAHLTYPYDPTTAAQLLDTAGFPVNPATGWRFWDMNGDGIEQPEEYLELKFFIRSDDQHRRDFGTWLAAELENVGVRVNEVIGTITAAWFQVLRDKDFHLYTGGWSLGVDPDHLTLWNWDFYWHPGFCNNYAACNNQTFNQASYGVLYANTFEEAKINAWKAQEAFCGDVLSIPLWSYSGFKAIRRHYSGGTAGSPVTPDDGENQYRGQYWEGLVNMPGYGIDNHWTLLNMHPQGFELGDGENLTIRWGFKTSTINSLNPLYAQWPWEWKILDLIYDKLITRNPYNLAEFIPWLATNFEVSTYSHPIYGTCTKIALALRTDVYWSDGTPLTAADIAFTLVELPKALEAIGLPPPIWIKNVMDITSVDPREPTLIEILFNTKTIWALSGISQTPILPKHIWKPLILGPDLTPGTEDDGTYETVYSFAPDPNLIGSGPWRLVEYIEFSHVLMVANRPGSTVQTNIEGSVPIMSPYGYFASNPIRIKAYADGFHGKFTIDGPGWGSVPSFNMLVNFIIEVHNLHASQIITVDKYVYMDESLIWHTPLAIDPLWVDNETLQLILYSTFHTLKVAVYINTAGFPWDGVWVNYTYPLWITFREDITGSTFYDDIGLSDYPYKSQLPTSDFSVNNVDTIIAFLAFGSYPGHERWNSIADINHNYIVDILDIYEIGGDYPTQSFSVMWIKIVDSAPPSHWVWENYTILIDSNCAMLMPESGAFNYTLKEICFNLDVLRPGYCAVSIPKQVLHGGFALYLNGTLTPSVITWTSTQISWNQISGYTYINFTLDEGYYHVRIVGEHLTWFPGDVNKDGKVDILDIGTAALNFGQPNPPFP